MESKEEYYPIHINSRTKKILSLSWNISGNYLATFSSDSLIKIWSYEDQDLQKAFDLKGHTEKVGNLCWHPKQEQILASAGYDNTLKIWDWRTSTTKGTNSISWTINEKTKESNVNLCWNPEGNIIAVGNVVEEISFYDYRNWKLINTISFQSKKWELNELAWDRSGTFLFIPNTSGNVYALDGSNPEVDSLIEIHAHFGTTYCIAISNNNDYFATGSADSNLFLWDMYEFAWLRSMKKRDSIINQISFSHDDQYIAAACCDEVQKKYNIDIFDVDTGDMLYSASTKGIKRSVAWHPKSNVLAYGGEENKQGVISLLPFNKKS